MRSMALTLTVATGLLMAVAATDLQRGTASTAPGPAGSDATGRIEIVYVSRTDDEQAALIRSIV